MEYLNDRYFDCPHCKIKRVTYNVIAKVEEGLENVQENWDLAEDDEVYQYRTRHLIVQCNQCNRLTYFKIVTGYDGNKGYKGVDNLIIFQYPSGKAELPEYVPENIRKFYQEAVDAYNFGLLNSASIMCRKVIYELCDKKRSTGRDYKEKIKNLGLDKGITDPLLNLKNIGDETVHAKGWGREMIRKAIDTLSIIIDKIYVQEEQIKNFTKNYSKAKSEREQE